MLSLISQEFSVAFCCRSLGSSFTLPLAVADWPALSRSVLLSLIGLCLPFVFYFSVVDWPALPHSVLLSLIGLRFYTSRSMLLSLIGLRSYSSRSILPSMIGLRLSFVCRFRSVLLPLIGLRIYRSRFMLLFVVPCSLQALRIVDFDEEALVAGFKSWFGGIL